jgi:hypothetical protein
MTPTTSEREALVADLETVWHSVSDDADTNAAYQRLKAALTRQEAQQGGEPKCPKCAFATLLYECPACSATNYPPQQEAQGAVAHDVAMEGWHSAVDAAGELCTNAPDERYRTRAESVRQWIVRNKPTTPPASVDVRLRELVETWRGMIGRRTGALAQMRHEIISSRANELEALLDGQPAGVAHEWNCASAFSPHCTCGTALGGGGGR